MARRIASLFFDACSVRENNFTFDALSSEEDRPAKKTGFYLYHDANCNGEDPFTQGLITSIAHAIG